MLTVVYAECRKLALNGECHYTQCRYAEWRYAECRGAIYSACNLSNLLHLRQCLVYTTTGRYRTCLQGPMI
jgi:hypothetical protein